ncbi:MAG: hypothetical protein NTX61_02490 [Bacteroidetes bacterium]|nr:hypothetical protein [Bacteroidota bacterium]
MTYANGNSIEGIFTKGVRNGISKFTYKNGETTEGNYNMGCADGDFTFTFPCGDRCIFSFKNGAINQRGTYFYKDEQFTKIEFSDLASQDYSQVLERTKTKLAFVWLKAGSGLKDSDIEEKNRNRDRIYLLLAYLCAENGSFIKEAAWEVCMNDPWIKDNINSFQVTFLLKSLSQDKALKAM